MDISSALTQWRTWDEKSLSKMFEFDDFVQAIDFVNQIAVIAESHDHHPDIDIRWNTVMLVTTTHDAGSVITQKDVDLITSIDNLI